MLESVQKNAAVRAANTPTEFICSPKEKPTQKKLA